MSSAITPGTAVNPAGEAVAAPIVVPARSGRRPFNRDRLIAVLMILPSIVAIAIFVYGFIAWTAWASLLDWRGLGEMVQVGPVRFPNADFEGFYNYERLFNTPRFITDLQNNGIFTLAFL